MSERTEQQSCSCTQPEVIVQVDKIEWIDARSPGAGEGGDAGLKAIQSQAAAQLPDEGNASTEKKERASQYYQILLKLKQEKERMPSNEV